MGSIELIFGPMFCGKTEELIRRMKREIIAKKNVVVFKPKKDNRYNEDYVCSHNGNTIECVIVSSVEEIRDYVFEHPQINVIGIEEIQFFNFSIVHLLNEIRNQGLKIICAGLDLDFKGNPFDVTSYIASISDRVDKLTAICMRCGKEATMSFRKVKSEKTILVGAAESYEARCRTCWHNDMKDN